MHGAGGKRQFFWLRGDNEGAKLPGLSKIAYLVHPKL